MSDRKPLLLACLLLSALPLLAGCGQGGDNTAIAAGPRPAAERAPVIVVNEPSNPVPVTITSTLTVKPFAACATASDSAPANLLTVPSGKVAVIEYVEGSFSRPNATSLFPVIELFGVFPNRFASFTSVNQGGDSSSRFIANHLTKLYALPGSVLTVQVSSPLNSLGGGGSICITGHYQPAAT